MPSSKTIKEDNNNNVQQKLDENRSLREELNEKNKLIKNLQQRLNDMKKTLQKELKYQSLPNEPSVSAPPADHDNGSNAGKPSQQEQQQQMKNGFKTTAPVTPALEAKAQLVKKANQPAIYPASSQSAAQSNPALSMKRNSIQPNHLSNLHEDVNFKYLKHVVLKFVTSREYEVSLAQPRGLTC